MIELIIAVFIGSMLIAAATATYIAQNRSFAAQESVAEVNTQSKIAHDLVSNDIRSTGFGVAVDMSLEPVNGYTEIIIPIDNTTAPDTITVVGGFRKVGSLWPTGTTFNPPPTLACPSATSVVPLATNQIVIYYDPGISVAQGPNATDMQYLSIDGIDFVRVNTITTTVASGRVSAAITLDRNLSQNFPLVDNDGDGNCDVGRPVYLVEDVTFCINTTDNTLRRIWRTTTAGAASCTGIDTSLVEVLADNVEDLQLAYSLDLNNDGKADNINNFVNGSAVADPSTIKAVRVNVLARTDRPDPQYRDMGSRPVTIENRNEPAGVDSFRRRWWQTIVSVRND